MTIDNKALIFELEGWVRVLAAPGWDNLATSISRASAALQSAAEREQELVAALEQSQALLDRAETELRLIRSKDCNAVYDTTLRMDFALHRNIINQSLRGKS